ncbi:hypothetical protein FB558_7696 [Pseudonocardia kunmingensis]|uniref:Uncharacterized protein n=1 Tax=Pseudonocardia kunmingensis TaxID=630975 RepID=A0A543D1G9_9PSEU|nr:hypothetical protein FB558_7696 [Pseudonocardia kunmingensis]
MTSPRRARTPVSGGRLGRKAEWDRPVPDVRPMRAAPVGARVELRFVVAVGSEQCAG